MQIRPCADIFYDIDWTIETEPEVAEWLDFFTEPRRIVLLTAFRKQRQNERNEVQRARDAMARCIAEQHTAED